MKRLILLLVTMAATMVVALMMVAMAVPAFAQGQVEQGPEHANSICSFSGQNDTPNDPAPEGGRVQSYGQLVQQGAAEPSAQPGPAEPGVSCNAHNAPLQEGSGPPE
jgi:hypothetical protein